MTTTPRPSRRAVRKEGREPQAKQSKARPSSAISQTAVAVGNKKGAASVTGAEATLGPLEKM